MRPGLIPTSRPPKPQSTHGYMVTTTAGPTSPLGMTTPAAAFRPAPIEPIAAIAAPTHPLTPTVLDAVAPPPLAPALPASSISLTDSDIRAVEWETVLTPRARLLLPGDQQLKFTALARRTVTVWANDRSIHVVLDRTVIRTRPLRLSEHDLRDLLSPGARIRRNRICAWCRHRRHADHQRGNRGKPHRRPWRLRRPRGCKILLDPPLEGQRVTLRFNGALMHVLARGRLVKTLPAPLEPHRRATLRGVRPGVEPLPPPAPPQARCDASPRTDDSWSQDSACASDAPMPDKPLSSPSRTPFFECYSTTSNSPRSPKTRPADHQIQGLPRRQSASSSPLLPIGLRPGSPPRSSIHHGYASPRQDHQFARTAVSSHRHSITVNRCHMAPEAVRASVGDMDAHAVSRQVIHHRHRAHQVTRIHVL